jgi:hypothetical protein
MARFVVDLGNVKLPNEVKKRINSGIQKVVLDELAVLEGKTDYVLRIPKGWLGMLLRLLRKQDIQEQIQKQLQQVEKQIVTFGRQ